MQTGSLQGTTTESAGLSAGSLQDSSDGVVLSSMDQAVRTPWLSSAKLMGIAGLLLVTCITAFAFVRLGGQRTLTVTGERLLVSEVRPGTFHEYIAVSGSVVPATTIYLDAVEGGQIVSVHAEAGMRVQAGDVLATLRNTNLQLEVIGREAQLTEQLNNLSSTRLAFEQNRLRHEREVIELEHRFDRVNRELLRQRAVVERGGAAQSEIVDLEAESAYLQRLLGAVTQAREVDEQLRSAQIGTLQKAIDAMTANLSIARENLENLVITAPVAGQLTSFDANLGASTAPGERIGQIDVVDQFSISALVDEYYLARVRIGQSATALVDEDRFSLTVTRVFPEVLSRQFEIELEFTGAAPKLMRRGQTLRLQLEIGRPAETLMIANGAFFDDTGGAWVFVLQNDAGYAVRRSVRLGRRNPEGIEVLGGLSEGDRVITSSYANFVDFDRIALSTGI